MLMLTCKSWTSTVLEFTPSIITSFPKTILVSPSLIAYKNDNPHSSLQGFQIVNIHIIILQNVYFRLSEVAFSSKRFAKMQLPICPFFHKFPQSCSDSFLHMTYAFQLQICLDLSIPLQPPICTLCCPTPRYFV